MGFTLGFDRLMESDWNCPRNVTGRPALCRSDLATQSSLRRCLAVDGLVTLPLGSVESLSLVGKREKKTTRFCDYPAGPGIPGAAAGSPGGAGAAGVGANGLDGSDCCICCSCCCIGPNSLLSPRSNCFWMYPCAACWPSCTVICESPRISSCGCWTVPPTGIDSD